MAQKATLDKPLDDGTGAFARRVGTWFEGPETSVAKQTAMGPFVVGLYGFKTLRITNIAVGKLESMHLNICRIMLGLYDDEIDAHLQLLIDKGAKADGYYFPTDAEKAEVQKYVIRKHGAKYMGFTPDFKPVPIDKVASWKFSAGSALGEIAADVTGWYKFPNNAAYDKNIQESLNNLGDVIGKAPSGISTNFITNLNQLKSLGSKAKFSYPERQTIAAALAKTLISSLELAAVQSAPSYIDKAVGTYQITNTMMGRTSQIVLRLTRTASGVSADMTDSGGARTLKFDAFQVNADSSYSFKLTHTNGAIMSGSGKFAVDFSRLTGTVAHRTADGKGSLSSSWSGTKK
jgi:hypothetical protein